MTVKRLFIHQPAAIWQAQVNSTTLGQVIDAIPYDTVTLAGAFDLDYTLLVGTTPGADDLGRTRVRYKSADTLYVNRSSRGKNDGEISPQDNSHLTVLHEFRLWAKIPYISSTGAIFKDADVSVGTYTTDLPPVAVMGSSTAGTIDPGTGLLTVAFDGTGSFQFLATPAYITGPVASYSWNVPTGTITVGTIGTGTITATFPPGEHYVELNVSSDAGKTHRARRMVYARDPNNDKSFTEFQIASRTIRPDGQEYGFRILKDIPRSTYIDGAAVLMWEGEPSSPSDRSHMQFVGWLHNDENTLTAERTGTLKDTTLHCLDITGKLKTLPGFPQRIESRGTPAKWTEMKEPSILKYIHYLLHWHSTALDLADWLPFTGNAALNGYRILTLGSEADTLFAQVDALARNVTPDHVFTCTRRGQMMIAVDPMVEDTATRTTVVQATLTPADWQSIRWPYQRAPRVYHLRNGAIISRDTYIMVNVGGTFVQRIEIAKSIAPASVPGQGATDMESNERIATNQFALNLVTGHRYARLNARYGLFTITLPWSRIKDVIDPARMEWVRLQIDYGSWRENPAFTAKRGLVREITVRYDYSDSGTTETATLQWEMETSGEPGQTVDVVYDQY